MRGGHAQLDDRRQDRLLPDPRHGPRAHPARTRATSRRSGASSPRCGARPSSTTSTSPTARRSTRSRTAILDRPDLGRAQLRRAAPGPAGRLRPRSTSSPQDSVNGPLHTNDSILFCGSPNFGNDVERLDRAEPGRARATCRPAAAAAPRTSSARSTSPAACCRCRSRTPSSRRPPTPATCSPARRRSSFSGSSVSVTNNGTTVSKALPPSGVIYVEEHELLDGLRPRGRPTRPPRAAGTSACPGTYSKDITIGADNDIIVMDDFKSSNTTAVLGGLIANNFVRVYHPVNCQQRLRQQRRPGRHPDRRRHPRAQPLVHRRQLVLRQRPRHAHRERRDRAEVPRPGRNLLRRHRQQRLLEELQLQRHADATASRRTS